jgi:hypothetical protein
MEAGPRRRKIITENRILWFISLFVSISLAFGVAGVVVTLFQPILESALLSSAIFFLVLGIFVFLGCIYLPRVAELAPGSWISLSGERRLSRHELALERARIELQHEEARRAREEAETSQAREDAERTAEAAERERQRAEGRASAARQLVRSYRKALLNTIATLEERQGMLLTWQASGRDLFTRLGYERGSWEQDREVLLQDGTYVNAVQKAESAFHAIARVPLYEDVQPFLLFQAQGAIAGAVIELQARLAELPQR